MNDTRHRLRRVAPLALLILIFSAPMPAGEAAADPAVGKLAKDLWFVGLLNQQPSLNMHSTITCAADGSRDTQNEMSMVITRSLGAQTMRMEMQQAAAFHEDAKGQIVSFRFDNDENGQRTSATGRIEGHEMVSTVHHLDRQDVQHLAIPAGVELVGDLAAQERIAHHEFKPGEKLTFAEPVLMGAQVVIAKSTATFKERDDQGRMTFDIVIDVMPVPTTMTVTPDGDLVAMHMSLAGLFTIDVAPSAGPAKLLGAELASTGLAVAKGPAPRSGPINHYRLAPDALAALPDDPFQSVADGVLTVASDAAPAPLSDQDRERCLRAEPQLELDDAKLRAWVEGVVAKHPGAEPAEIAEHLRLAVRSHITTKDLSKGDASALEAFRDRRGDCTEHANLLNAALRIADIPARTEVGLVFAADFGGWVGHAWNSAYVGDRWIHLDSAYPGTPRSCYLKLGTSSGKDPINTGAALMGCMGKVLGTEVETLQDAQPAK